MKREKSDRYIFKQKCKYAELINKNEGNMVSAFYEALKKNDLDIFENLIFEIEGESEYLKQVWNGLSSKTKKREELIDFSTNLGVKALANKYSDEFAVSAQTLVDEGILQFFDIEELMQVKDGEDIEYSVGSILNLFCDKDYIAGIHRTGGNVSGEEVLKSGIALTGHVSSGVGNRNVSNIDGLEQNISIINSPGNAVMQIQGGGSYKNYTNEEIVDIILVGIPKEERECIDIIRDENGMQYLNPKYIYGYAKVNSLENRIVDFIENDRYLQQEINQSSRNYTGLDDREMD